MECFDPDFVEIAFPLSQTADLLYKPERYVINIEKLITHCNDGLLDFEITRVDCMN